MPSLIQRLLSVRFLASAPPGDAAVPYWQERPPGAPAPAGRTRVLWTGSQVAPVPIIVRDPPEFFDPTR